MSQASQERKPIGRIIDGRLDLSGREFGDRDLKRLGVLPALRTLILTDTQVSNFALLKPQPNLETIVAINCPVQYLNGLSEQPSLSNLDLTNTPLSQKHNFRFLTIASVGKNIKIINNIKTTREEIKTAELMLRRQKTKLFLRPDDEENEELNSEEDRQTLEEMTTVYVKDHQKLFATFADNEAILYDLRTNGALPIIDNQSTEAEIQKAIKDVQKRNENLREAIRQKCEELGIECVLDA
ncbi:hypothetical protein M9Y10_009176 [Tritrichomonas musculus]|uniref:Leucine Rich Repeat family protein n=1 Tax=Tritrichomonas musculus TaxID=1915356 RepID=A0ABR2INT6_9EUKA